jgi:uncharacterized protein
MSTKLDSATPSLFGRTRGVLLAVFFGHPEQTFYFRQLLQMIGGGHGALQRELRALVGLGLIVFIQQGNQKLYRANIESPVFPEMRRLVAKTVGVHDTLRAALAPLASRIAVAFVYGSVARQQEGPNSDLDLMILADGITFEEVVTALSGAQDSLGREINPTVFSIAEFRAKLAARNHFLQTVMSGQKLFMLGNEDELAKLASKRVVG